MTASVGRLVRYQNKVNSLTIYQGQMQVDGAIGYVAKTHDYTIEISSSTQVVSASIAYSVTPNGVAAFGNGFWIYVNNSEVAHEGWVPFDPVMARSKTVPVGLTIGSNLISIKWDKTSLVPLYPITFDTTVTLTIYYTGSDPKAVTPTENIMKYVTWGFVIVGAAIVAAVGIKAYQAYKSK